MARATVASPFILQLDKDWRLLSASTGFADLLGRDDHQLHTMTLAELLPRADFRRLQQLADKPQAGSVTTHLCPPYPAHRLRCTASRIVDDVQIVRILVAAQLLQDTINSREGPVPAPINGQDEQATIAQALQRSEQRLSRSQAVANIGSWEWNVDSGELIWSEEVYQLFDVDADSFQLDYLNFLRQIHPDDLESVINSMNESLISGEEYDVQHRVMLRNQSLRWLRQRGSVVNNPQGEPECMYGVIQDITDFKQTEAMLRESESRFRQLAEHIREVFFIRDIPTNTMVYVSPAYETVWGRSLEEIYREPRNFIDQIHPEDKTRVLAARDGQDLGQPFNEEYRIVRDDGEIRWIWARTFPVYNDAGKLQRVVGLAEDITAMKEAEASRLARLREQRDTLVREVHHRIKNNLQGITGLLRTQLLTPFPQLRQPVERLISQVNSVAIIHGLQGKHHGSGLYVCELLTTIVENLNLDDTARPDITIDRPGRWQISEEEAVPVALILNELLTNAMKHRVGNATHPITVTLQQSDNQAQLTILTPGAALPPQFDFTQQIGTGTGLELVAALLPHRAASLYYRQLEHGVMTELVLEQPVIFPSLANIEKGQSGV